MRRIVFHSWSSDAQFSLGAHRGTEVSANLLGMADTTTIRNYTDPHGGGTASYEQSTWTSPET